MSLGGLRGTLERRAPWIVAAAAVLAALATVTTDPIGVFNDDGIYLLTAKALAQGLGYVYPQIPGNPPAIHYPPVWPALLAVVWKLAPPFPGSVGILKLINPLIIGVAAGGVVVLMRRLTVLPWWAVLALSIVAFVSIPVLLLTNLLLSEPLYLALLVPALLLAERVAREGGVRAAAYAAVLVALLVLVRTLGGTVFIATLMLLVHGRRWRELGVYAAVAIALLMPWQLYVWSAAPGFPDELRGSYGPYLEWVADGMRVGGGEFVAAVVRKDLSQTWAMFGVFFSPFVRGPVRALAAGLAIAAVLGGLWTLWASGRGRVTALSVTGYLAVVHVWPFAPERFVWVVWPVLLLTGAAGAHAAWRWLATSPLLRPAFAHAALASSAVMVAMNVSYNARGLARGWESRASAEMAEFGIPLVRVVLDDPRLGGKLIAAELAPMVALYADRQVIPVEIMTTAEYITRKLPAEHATEIERFDRRFRPGAYIVMQHGPYYQALGSARLDSTRTPLDVTRGDSPVRTILIMTQ